MTDTQLAAHLFVQVAVILAACRLVGWGARKLGQAHVIGEMIAGVLLGPSLLGLLCPAAFSWLFPPGQSAPFREHLVQRHPSMNVLFAVSQLGLVLYMFLVGLDLDVALLKSRKRGALYVSVAGIATPCVLGGFAALYLHQMGGLFSSKASPLVAAVFFGSAIAVTAFPMLARIIYECGIERTPLGTLALGSAAASDAAAWCLLAAVVGIADASPAIALIAIAGGISFVCCLFVVHRPFRRFFERWTEREGQVTASILAIALVAVMLCSWITETIGLHAVFGAFLAGAMMPRGVFAQDVRNKLYQFVTTLLLPIFFVWSGLNTNLSLLNSGYFWLLAAFVILIAVASKGIACSLAARMAGESWRDSIMIGTLMNARGLVELVILNIGLQRGLITPTLFTMMVLMAIVTTVMVSPIFNRLYGKNRPQQAGVVT